MDDPASAPRFPAGEPSDEWTVEQVLHWSLGQYQNRAIEQTARNVESLRDQCERECDDVMTLHERAVDMASKGDAAGSDAADDAGGDEENRNPQENADAEADAPKPEGGPGGKAEAPKPLPAAARLRASAAFASSASRPPPGVLEVRMIVGPHSEAKYLLRPRPGAPCFLGRSKGKKFTKNGVSLHKDQEVSTTHGKFVAEGGGLGVSATPSKGTGGEGGGGAAGGGPRFYFVDVGSTNGTVHNGEALEPNEQLRLEDGTELKVGNSVLKVVLG